MILVKRVGLIRALRALTPAGRLHCVTASCVAAARLLVEPVGSSTPPLGQNQQGPDGALLILVERVGFEPTEGFRPRRFSRPVL